MQLVKRQKTRWKSLRAGKWKAGGVSLPVIFLPAIFLPVILAGAVAGTALAQSGEVRAAETTPDARGAAAPSATLTRPRYIGAAGCAAAMCHGGGGLVGGERNPVGSEYTYWLSRDPHAHAYAVLLNEESAGIIKNLKASPLYADLPAASEAAICLTCHSISPGSYNGEPNPHGLQGGVSCEACHGPAEHWLAPHKRADWKTRPAAEKEALGLKNTKDLVARVQLCSECHVGGDAGRDVNHDLIAAGHPRLTFEFSAYQTNMPAHWNVAAERRAVVGGQRGSAGELQAAYEAKLWAVGQVGVARQTLELLALRAAGQSAQPVWPEFSELNCFDCHHRLETGSWRQARDYAARRPGLPAWGTWAWPLLPLLSSETGGPDLSSPDSPFRKLERAMIRPYPDREEVRTLVSALEPQLESWADVLNNRDDWRSDADQLLVGIATEGRTLAGRNWDAAAQTYHAVSALANAAQAAAPAGGGQDQIHEPLRAILEALRFSGTSGTFTYDSPPIYGDRVQAIAAELTRISDAIQRE
ncbi:MAG TPA: multiheme c-type cytochrome [Planctomycetaceae bacterium]|nr:multiheme c-type cytochrome [Planctomycetaceae bacterium]